MEGTQDLPQQVVYVQQAPTLYAKSSGLAIVLAFPCQASIIFILKMGRVGSKEQLSALSYCSQ